MTFKKGNKTIVTISINNELLNKVEDFQFQNRVPGRSSAIEQLLENGLSNASNDLEREEAKEFLIKLIKQL